MIKRRKKEMYNQTGNTKEYYLDSLDEWLTAGELVKLKGCELTKPTLQCRIYNKQNSPVYRTLDGCVFTPNMSNSKASNEHKQIIKEANAKADMVEFNMWLDVHKMFPVCGLEPRIIGSK